jgi:hypothetical protein
VRVSSSSNIFKNPGMATSLGPDAAFHFRWPAVLRSGRVIHSFNSNHAIPRLFGYKDKLRARSSNKTSSSKRAVRLSTLVL